MAQIDALLAHMTTTGTSRALLRGDAPSQLESPSGVLQGNVISNSDLQAALQEIAPIEAREALISFGAADFQYNGFNFHAAIENGLLRFDISPTAVAYSASPYAKAPLSSGTPVSEIPNDSGQGAASVVPTEVKGFNWGGFLLPWIWPLAHNTWIGLLSFIPIVGFFMRFFLGFKGNELGWKNRRFTSLEQFKQVQKSWMVAGLIVTIIGGATFPITAAILFPVFARARENARRSSCQANLKQVSLGIMQFVQDNDDKFPSSNSGEQLKQDLQPYLRSTEVFECPSDTMKGTSDYVYNTQLGGVGKGDLQDASSIPMAWDKDSTEHLGGRNIAFADGHVKWYREEDAQAWIAPYK